MSSPAFTGWEVLAALASLRPPDATAENEPDPFVLRNFLPTAPFKAALDPNILLVLGARGAGKSELFRVIQHGGWSSLMGHAHQDPRWFTFGRKDHPDPAVLSQHLSGPTSVRWRAYWFGLLAMRCREEGLLSGLPEPLESVRGQARPALAEWLPVAERTLEVLIAALDALDQRLAAGDTWLFVCYDELDALTPVYAELFPPIRELLALWFDRFRRWRRIRPKIFLRNDIFEARSLSFPDASKLLSGHKVELVWKADWLYRMWLKRAVNHSTLLDEFARSFIGGDFPEMGSIGKVPLDPHVPGIRQMVEHLVGPYMGANPRKGATWTWLPNHVQDSQQRVSPRAFLRLVFGAIQRANDRGQAGVSTAGILAPADFHGALIEASTARLQEFKEEDLWFDLIEPGLHDQSLPMEESLLLEILRRVRWPRELFDPRRPPVYEPMELIDLLVTRGVFERRLDGRLNVPDLYLYGLRMKRKGGIRRVE